jgi:hypothetical protein
MPKAQVPPKQPSTLIAKPLRDAPFDSGRGSDYALSPDIALLPRKERKQSEQDLDPDSWKHAEARHLPVYLTPRSSAGWRDPGQVSPLVFAARRALKADLANVAAGKGFLLQGGDCAESFPNSTPTTSATRSACCCRWRWC